MRCDVAELEISARLDGARDATLDASLEEHLASCARCRAFQAGTGRVRESVRLERAAQVPDLLSPIMRAVRAEPSPRRARLLAPRSAVVFLAGAAASALVLGGLPLLNRGVTPALAKEIPQLVATASLDVDAYSATFDITERNFHADVPERSFGSTITFNSPERFHSEVVDRTRYPSKRWPRNNLTLTVDGSRWEATGPATCPRQSLPVCATGGREVRSVRGREPFDGDTPLPSDIVVPVRTLADSQNIVVADAPRVAGRDVVGVVLPYRDAAPLFAYLHQSGSWRPFFALDRVMVSLDRETWLPLAYEVRASANPERARWARRNTLPAEGGGDLLFTARTRSFELDEAGIDLDRLGADQTSRDAGFRDIPPSAVPATYEPVIPLDLRGLRLHRMGRFTNSGDDEIVLSYARGLAWLKIRATRTWDQPTLYGNISSLASPLRLNTGVVYVEPATATLGHRVSIHTDAWDVFLESNHSSELPAVVDSLPVKGTDVPNDWLVRTWPGGIVREQVSIARALDEVPYLLVPKALPKEYRLTVHLVRAAGSEGVTLFYRRDMEPDGIGVKIHLAPKGELPPPLEPETFSVSIAGVVGRYTPDRNELEWVADGTYRSVAAHGLDLSRLIEIAESLRPPAR